MVETFLRVPRDTGEVVADAIRLLGLISGVLAGVTLGPLLLGVFGLVAIGLVVPRFLGVRPALDIATSIVLLVAAWANALDLYVLTPAIDIPVHLLLNGLIAALAVVLFQRVGVLPALPPRALVLVTVAIGFMAGVLWEVGEWAGNRFLDPSIFVAYDDTIGDLVVGGLGALVAGLAMPWVTADSRWQGARQTAPSFR
ncbi:hypothetical protein ACFDTO_31465 [Microbacteriaceae bacterium 4G12]